MKVMSLLPMYMSNEARSNIGESIISSEDHDADLLVIISDEGRGMSRDRSAGLPHSSNLNAAIMSSRERDLDW